jgi:hypothetical protein
VLVWYLWSAFRCEDCFAGRLSIQSFVFLASQHVKYRLICLQLTPVGTETFVVNLRFTAPKVLRLIIVPVIVSRTLSQPPGWPSLSGPTFAGLTAQAVSSRSVRKTWPCASSSGMISSSGNTTPGLLPYFVGQDDTNRTGALTASRKALRESVNLP